MIDTAHSAPAKPPRDALLGFTKGLLYALMGLAGIVALAVAGAGVAIWFAPDHVTIDDTTLVRSSFGAISLIMAMIFGMALLAIRFLEQIVAIIDSVNLGSPFVRENARRLRIAAWCVLAIEGLGLIAETLGGWVHSRMPKSDIDIDIDVSLGWLVTALLLFILARVFDHGTRLAEDVEATV